ncbi:MAG: nucleoside phosphorylase [Caldisphaera sp.]|uniref:5'-methylthioadenosine/S-adenosylhomocysteine nucleosidase family protein n=1 Tax=Caldisphaera sp. TaxID=2060322 RepID=UPI0025BAF65A|nr:nucleoside phosphorylase [Caldisphaera sp.]
MVNTIKIAAVIFLALAIIGFGLFAYEYSIKTKIYQQTNSSINNTASNSYLFSIPMIGIVTPMAMEQAPILAVMKNVTEINISGYTFYVGKIGNQWVVNVRSGEKEYAAELATYIMDTHFHIIANILSGTAGSRNPYVLPGDVVIGAYVVDKSSIHYHNRGFQSDYTGVEMVVSNKSLINNSIIGGYGEVGPTLQNASYYGYGPGTTDKNYVYIAAFPASLGLVQIAQQAQLGYLPASNISSNSTINGLVKSQIIVGVIGSANQWTEPLVWQLDQNALYQTDAGENEGMGFAYVNAELGIPWIIVRGISDSPWFPNTYIGVYAAQEAANVTIYIIEHFSYSNLYQTVNESILSNVSNAKLNHYLIALRAYYSVGNVTMIKYLASNGTIITIISPNISEYTYAYGYKVLDSRIS